MKLISLKRWFSIKHFHLKCNPEVLKNRQLSLEYSFLVTLLKVCFLKISKISPDFKWRKWKLLPLVCSLAIIQASKFSIYIYIYFGEMPAFSKPFGMRLWLPTSSKCFFWEKWIFMVCYWVLRLQIITKWGKYLILEFLLC